MNQMEQIMEEMRRKRAAKQASLNKEENGEDTMHQECGCGAIS